MPEGRARMEIEKIVMLNRIYNEDCIKTLAKIPSEYVDLVFADPPFNVNIKYNGYRDIVEDYYEWQNIWINECFRILKPSGSFWLMTITRHLPMVLTSMSKHGVFINLIKWKNVASVNNKRSFWNGDQPIVFFGKSNQYKFNHLAEVKYGDKLRLGKYKTKPQGQLLDYWDDIPMVYAGSIKHPEAILKPGSNKKEHPAQMPEKLIGRILNFCTDEGDIVYDPFMGSGTTASACQKMNRKFIGSEISNVYYDLCLDRINQKNYQLF